MSRMLIEIAACLIAAGVLGLLAGWMASRATSRRRQRATRTEWQRRYSELELQSGRDIDELEAQVQELADKVRKLTHDNRLLDESLKKTEAGIHQARTEAIELNRQQASTQERLQKLLRQKDDEIAQLQSGETAAHSLAAASSRMGASVLATRRVSELQSGDGDVTQEIRHARQSADTLRDRQSMFDGETDALDEADLSQQTVAIDRTDLPSELFDATVRVDPDNLQQARMETADTIIDATVALDGDSDANDATMLIEPPFADTEDQADRDSASDDRADTVIEAIDTDGTDELPPR